MKRGLILLACGLPAFGQPLPGRAVAIIEQRCAACHGQKTAMSGLRLTDREAALRGGTRGPAIVPGKAEASLLVQAVAGGGKLAMPPGGRLAADEAAALREWIEQGAAWPSSATAAAKPRAEWWAFARPVRRAVPAGAANPVDAFVAQKLRASGVTPSAPADRLALLRRACFDLLGLPPTAAQAREFLDDASADAWPRLIDRLLASPQYGEKWGRHWLDLVRYGDTSGFEQDPYNLEAWRYRDWVVASLNADKPYDRFVKEQIAGDELWPEEPEARVGTGFYRVGANRDMLFKVEELNQVEKLTDWVDTTSSVFLGLTVGCARCHDHKFDPIPQRDYYRMQAHFAAVVNDRVFLEYNSGRFYDLAANTREFRLRQIGAEIDRIQKPYRERLREEKAARLDAAAQAVLKIKAEQRTPQQQSLATEAEEKLKISQDEIRAAMSQADAERQHAIEKRLLGTFAGYGPPPMSPGVIDSGREAPRTYIAERGNHQNPGAEVRPGYLSVLGGGETPEPPLHATTTGRRKALAEWMARAENPLFARVMVNRVWQYHFGAGLVKTGSDFGTRAGKPSHPELLDWLATEFAAQGWSLKALHRLIMTSETYRRDANPTDSARRIDPANELLAHFSRRRLQSEEIHDAVLASSGALNPKMGGAPVVPPLEAEELFGIIGQPDSAWMVTPDVGEHTRRSLYMLRRRTFQQPMAEAFDSPDGVLSCSRRNESTTAPQSLALMNSRFMLGQAKVLAEAIAKAADPVGEAWRRVLVREPRAHERAAAEGLISRQSGRLGSKEAALAELARGLMNLNEFLYVE